MAMARVTGEESKATFRLRFLGRNEMDADALSVALSNMSDLIKTTTARRAPDAYAKLYVGPPRNGSVAFDLFALVCYSPSLLNNLSLAKDVLGMVLDYFEIKKHLKGEPPKQIEAQDNSTHIENHAGERLTVGRQSADEFFKNAHFDNCIIYIVNSVGRDENRTGFELEVDSRKIDFPAADFPLLSRFVVPEKPASKTIVQTISVELLLKKADLLGSSRWEFVLDRNIEAQMADQNFQSAVHEGREKRLYAGVKIPCDLKIEVSLDANGNPLAARYTVLKVTGAIIEPESRPPSQPDLPAS